MCCIAMVGNRDSKEHSLGCGVRVFMNYPKITLVDACPLTSVTFVTIMPLGSLFADYAKLSTFGPEIALNRCCLLHVLGV